MRADIADGAFAAAFPDPPEACGCYADRSRRPLDDCIGRQVWTRACEQEHHGLALA